MTGTVGVASVGDGAPCRTVLTVCVIGRNESKNLPRLIDSLKVLDRLPYRTETVFVDSASADNSVEIARAFFDRVYVLKESSRLCASAARYVGTLAAAGQWILYLDGDMELASQVCEMLAALPQIHERQQGWVGICCDVFDDGSKRHRGMLTDSRGIAQTFGGAVLLPRKMVLEAGNWDPAVFSNEEIDLYTRLRRLGGLVFGHHTVMVLHSTKRVSFWRTIAGNVFPGLFLGKRCYGFGQILASRMRKGSFANLVRWYPAPFVCWGSIALAVLAGLCLGSLWAGLALAAGWCGAAAVVGYKRVVIFNLLLVHAVIGLWHYDPTYHPQIAAVYRGGIAEA